MAGLRERGLIDTDGWFTDAGRETKNRIEALTDELAAPPYDALSPAELDELVAELEPISATVGAAGLSPRASGERADQTVLDTGAREPGGHQALMGGRSALTARSRCLLSSPADACRGAARRVPSSPCSSAGFRCRRRRCRRGPLTRRRNSGGWGASTTASFPVAVAILTQSARAPGGSSISPAGAGAWWCSFAVITASRSWAGTVQRRHEVHRRTWCSSRPARALSA